MKRTFSEKDSMEEENGVMENGSVKKETEVKKMKKGVGERFVSSWRKTKTKEELMEELLTKDEEQIKKQKYFVQFENGENGEDKSMVCEVNGAFSTKQMNELLNSILVNDEEMPYNFYWNDKLFENEKETISTKIFSEIKQIYNEETSASVKNPNRFNENREKVKKIFESIQQTSGEKPLIIKYLPESLFKVRPVSRCSATLYGHSEAILNVQFAPDGRGLASAGGDATVRLWDVNTETPLKTMKGHTNWVLVVCWSPDAQKIASGSKDKIIKVWFKDGRKCCNNLKGHKLWITGLAWQPFHIDPSATYLASSSKDTTVKIWNTKVGKNVHTLSGHTKGVTCIKWNGDNCIYSCSQDCTIRIWDMSCMSSNSSSANQGKPFVKHILQGHAHWVNTMTMSTDYTIRRGAFDHNCESYDPPMRNTSTKETTTETSQNNKTVAYETYVENRRKEAQERYDSLMKITPLRIITGSDDNTLCLWDPVESTKPISRITGHQGVVNQVQFSPNGQFIASCSFDKTIKVWHASNGKLYATLRGHVGPVYQICWSGDSRLIASCSKDSTGKIWNIKTKKLVSDLPGHYDEVYTVDWSLDGQRVASAGKDRMLKIYK